MDAEAELARIKGLAADRRARQRQRERDAYIPGPETIVQALAYGLRSQIIERGGLRALERGSDLYMAMSKASKYLDSRFFDMSNPKTKSRLLGGLD